MSDLNIYSISLYFDLNIHSIFFVPCWVDFTITPIEIFIRFSMLGRFGKIYLYLFWAIWFNFANSSLVDYDRRGLWRAQMFKFWSVRPSLRVKPFCFICKNFDSLDKPSRLIPIYLFRLYWTYCISNALNIYEYGCIDVACLYNFYVV